MPTLNRQGLRVLDTPYRPPTKIPRDHECRHWRPMIAKSKMFFDPEDDQPPMVPEYCCVVCGAPR